MPYLATPNQRELLEQTIAALEAQRAALGDLVVDTALAPLRAQLAALAQPAAPLGTLHGERKSITVLLADVKGSTDLAERLHVEEWVETMNRLFHLLENEIYRLGGEVNQFRGDGLLAFFGATVVHEDDPERAVLAALAMQRAAAGFAAELRVRRGVELQLRVGINTGEVIVTQVGDARQHSEDTAMGRSVALAARMESAAEPGTVLATEATYRLIASRFEWQPLGEIMVKGFSQPVTVYRPLAHRAWGGSGRGVAGLYSPLVGRDAERWALHGALARLQAGLGGVVTVIGEAGLGKSRLVTETRTQLNGCALTWVEGRCLSYGAADAYHLWRDVLRGLFALAPGAPCAAARDALRVGIAALCPEQAEDVFSCLSGLLIMPGEAEFGVGDDAPVEFPRQRISVAMEAVLCAAARRAPLVVVCEDLHWADATSLTLLEHVAALAERLPALFVCVMRPDAEQRSWQLRAQLAQRYAGCYTEIWLKPLSPVESEALVGNLLRVAMLSPELRAHILDRAEGNPFYVEEIVRDLMDSGVIRYDAGYGFWRLAQEPAAVVIPDTLQGVLMARMDRLPAESKRVLQVASVIGRLFLYPVLAAMLPVNFDLDRQLAVLEESGMIRERAQEPEREFIFKHQLTQEAAYNGLLLGERRILHREVAEAIKALFPDRLWANAGLLAYHWQEAGEPNRAIPHLIRAGGAAVSRSAYAEAEVYLRRALALAQGAGLMLAEADALSRLGHVARMRGDYAEAWTCLERALEFYRRFSNRRREGVLLGQLGTLAQRRGDFDAARLHLERALEITHLVRDRHGEPIALRNLGGVCLDLGDCAAAAAHFEAALRVERAFENRWGISLSLTCLANARRLSGDYVAARRCVEQGLALSVESDYHAGAAWAALVSAWLLHELGEDAAAHPHARGALRCAQERSDRAAEGDAFVALGEALLGLRRFSEAHAPFEAAAEIRAALGEHHLLVEPCAGLAQAALLQGDHAALARQTAQLAEYLARYPALQGIHSPVAIRELARQVLPAFEYSAESHA